MGQKFYKLSGLWRQFQWWLLPPHCVLSNQYLTMFNNDNPLELSHSLRQQITKPVHVCPVCCEPLDRYYVIKAENQSKMVCGTCQSKAPYFDKTRVAGYFDGVLKQLIYDFKYQQQTSYAKVLVDIFLQQCPQNNLLKVDALIAVPIHAKRRRARGYNQADLLAKQFSQQLGLLYPKDIVIRQKDTPSQTRLTAHQRQQNIAGVFRVLSDTINKYPPIKRLAIIDDVITSGATVNELAKQLKQSGIEYIEVWALAKKS